MLNAIRNSTRQSATRRLLATALLLTAGAAACGQTLEYAAVSAGGTLIGSDELFILGEASGPPAAASAIEIASGSVPILFPPNLPGDLNCDGALDFFDIDPFLLALFDPAGYAATFPDCDINHADVNGDGMVDFFDIDPFLLCLFGGCP